VPFDHEALLNKDHDEHYAQAKGGAIAAADAIRRFISQVEDQQVERNSTSGFRSLIGSCPR